MNQSNPKTVAPYEENYLFEYHVVNLVSMNVLQNKLTKTQKSTAQWKTYLGYTVSGKPIQTC